jgi:Icc-related predicted phosphoesterase
MIRRLTLNWRQPVDLRLLAVSDEPERALDFERNRTDLGRVDGIIGAGDLPPDYMAFLADAFHAPLLYVRGNHDRGANWTALERDLPRPLDARSDRLAGVKIAGVGWPGRSRGRALRDESAAWAQAIGLIFHLRGKRPPIMVSHVPPRGLGDTLEDHYHRGFAAYHWLCRRLNPRLWIHGHTALAAAPDWRTDWGGTTLVNATGAVLIELTGSGGPQATGETQRGGNA